MTDSEWEIDPEVIPAGLLQKKLRAREYARAKALRKKRRQEEKARKEQNLKEERQSRDEHLWESLRPASDLKVDGSGPEKSDDDGFDLK